MRITKNAVRAKFAGLCHCAQTAGVDTSNWKLIISGVDTKTYRILDDGSTVSDIWVSSKEAYYAMQAMIDILYLVVTAE